MRDLATLKFNEHYHIKDNDSMLINGSGNIQKNNPLQKYKDVIEEEAYEEMFAGIKLSKEKQQELKEKGAIGYVVIKEDEKVILEKFNAIHQKNLSLTTARALANREDGHIHEMHFGNGASNVSGTNVVTYLPPNVSDENADLYNRTYYKVIDQNSPLNTDITSNNIEVIHQTVGTKHTDIKITCTLAKQEPSGQAAYDDTTDFENDYVFDEFGLKAFSPLGPGTGLLLSHVIHHPIQKSLNRKITVVYYIRIAGTI